MEKSYIQPLVLRRKQPHSSYRAACSGLVVGLLGAGALYIRYYGTVPHISGGDLLGDTNSAVTGPSYGVFPAHDDPFQFLPCTSSSVLPSLDDAEASKTWAQLYDPNPEHWSWGKPQDKKALSLEDPYSGRGIYLCGYLDIPLDYTNASDSRITRLAVTKYQVSGLARVDVPLRDTAAGKKSARTIVANPGGPGGSGTNLVWRAAEEQSLRLSDGQFDVLGWDPRGVNATLPAVECFPYDVDRDHWSLLQNQFRAVSPSPKAHLEFNDALNEATFRSCWERQGDLARFVSTAFVARDVEEIRKALGEDELTAWLVSYGTGIGQTYANMFPDSVGRMILDGTEYVPDHRELGGFGWTALDNGTNAWHDGFLGECINAGPDHCDLAKPKEGKKVTLEKLQSRLEALFKKLVERPIPAYRTASGPTLITYSELVSSLYGAMYNAKSWPALATMLYELEAGNATLAAAFLDRWEYDPTRPCPLDTPKPSSAEQTFLVICADSYDAPQPEGLDWWIGLWKNMTEKSWIAGDLRFNDVFPCRHFNEFWPKPAEVYRGDLDHKLKNPVLLVAETYDPATPLRNGRRLLSDMGDNARLIVHHGYGHSSRDTSACTEAALKAYILNGTLPADAETPCFADEKPYLYGVKSSDDLAAALEVPAQRVDPVSAWREHQRELEVWGVRY
ncbi:protease [Xylariales sp. PMI_506]|nr:protease [Xylariales sp. PMI_506]